MTSAYILIILPLIFLKRASLLLLYSHGVRNTLQNLRYLTKKHSVTFTRDSFTHIIRRKIFTAIPKGLPSGSGEFSWGGGKQTITVRDYEWRRPRD